MVRTAATTTPTPTMNRRAMTLGPEFGPIARKLFGPSNSAGREQRSPQDAHTDTLIGAMSQGPTVDAILSSRSLGARRGLHWNPLIVKDSVVFSNSRREIWTEERAQYRGVVDRRRQMLVQRFPAPKYGLENNLDRYRE
ncbi:hypothetical protein CDD83_4440 [Cordyceps sp. RAO-2017]|nr:hypothetical protein CDD83_4440 [Cordyceps sp. RAO-2017]